MSASRKNPLRNQTTVSNETSSIVSLLQKIMPRYGSKSTLVYSLLLSVIFFFSCQTTRSSNDLIGFGKALKLGMNEAVLLEPQFIGTQEGIRIGLFFKPGPIIIPTKNGERTSPAFIEPKLPRLSWHAGSEGKNPYLLWQGKEWDVWKVFNSSEKIKGYPFWETENWWWHGINRFPENMVSVEVRSGDLAPLFPGLWKINFQGQETVVRLFSIKGGIMEPHNMQIQLSFQVTSENLKEEIICSVSEKENGDSTILWFPHFY